MIHISVWLVSVVVAWGLLYVFVVLPAKRDKDKVLSYLDESHKEWKQMSEKV